MIANTGELNAVAITRQVADLFIKQKERAKDQPTFAQMDHSPSIDPTAFQGYYKNARTSAGLRLIANKEFLFTNRGDTLIPIGDNTFKLQQAVVRFTGDLQKPMMLINSINFPDTIIYTRTVQPTQDSLTLSNYSGNYFSEPLKTSLSVSFKDAGLKMTLSNGKVLELLPVYKDGFDLKPQLTNGINAIYFTKSEAGKLTMHVVLERAWDIVFEKID